MEAMALGKPVIATGWSGNMRFMDHGSACLVSYDLAPVSAKAIDQYYRREFWVRKRFGQSRISTMHRRG